MENFNFKRLIKNGLDSIGVQINRKKNNRNDNDLYTRLFSKSSIENRKFYNISAGGHFDFGCGIHHPLWTNVDIVRPWKNEIEYNPKLDIAHDLLSLRPIPIESNSAEIVYSRVSIEHITDEAAQLMFKEVKRILKKNGIFRVVTPNIDLDYRAFLKDDKDYFFWASDYSIEQAFLSHFAHGASPMSPENAFEKISDEKFRMLFDTMKYADALNYCISKCDVTTQMQKREHHINWWNPVKLERMLTYAGFSTVYLSASEQSVCPVLRNEIYFDNVFPKAMFYMEAVNE